MTVAEQKNKVTTSHQDLCLKLEQFLTVGGADILKELKQASAKYKKDVCDLDDLIQAL